ncbi:hypothetical protein V493_03843 [Pseudogymnoascus sp. VKM F-4281 (FW-2241)]|nr:hypothetical protein V493_03843 [Pseudogymnoascus sp. VKM F-4281 (FW-2241)]
MTKASKSIGDLTRLAGSTWGTSVAELRRIYQAVVIPQMMCGCSAWSVAQERGEGFARGGPLTPLKDFKPKRQEASDVHTKQHQALFWT